MRSLTRPSPVLFASLFASQAALLVLSPVLADVAREFGTSTAAAGQLRAISGATGGVVALGLAIAPRRPGLRDLLAAGALLVAAASALSAAAPSFAVLAGAQAVAGAGVGLLVAAGIAAAGPWGGAERARVLAWAIAGMPAAWVAAMPAVGAVSGAGWRAAFLVPAVAGLAALALVRARPADAPSRSAGGAAAAWRSAGVARFTAGELLANAAWASVLTYAGALVLASYDVSPAVVAFGLGASALAMIPGTFLARGSAATPTRARLAALTGGQGAAVLVLATARPAAAATLAVLSAMAFVNGRRTMIASALGMDSAPVDPLAAMAMRAAANQFGYLLGAAAGGLALAAGGFPAFGVALAAMFAAAALVHAPGRPSASPTTTPTKGSTMFPADRYVIRTAAPEDAAALARLADIDSQRPLDGRLLVGELDGRLAAAVSLDDGRVIADPFRPTGHLAAHLRVRAAGVGAHERTPSVRERMLSALPASYRRAARSSA